MSDLKEHILFECATEHMNQFSLIGFKKDYKKLFKTIMCSMQKYAEKECEKISEASITMTKEEIEAREEKIKELEEWKRCQNLKTKDRAGEWNDLVNKQALNEITNKENINKFVKFLKAEGIVVEEEDKPQDFNWLYDVWSGKNPMGLV